MNGIYLFVYGTLLQDSQHEMSKFLVSRASFVGKGYFQGKLFQVSWYPGAVLSDCKSDKVYGSIYKLNNDKAVFQVLDDYEGAGANQPEPHLFKRKQVNVYLENASVKTWVYLYNHPIDDLKRILSGDFFKT